MKDDGDIATRRERLQAIKQRRQDAPGDAGSSGDLPPRSLAGTVGPGPVFRGGKVGGQPQRVKQLANLIVKWLETQSASGSETIANTGVSRKGLANLMTLLSNMERKSGPGAKIAQSLRAFLARPPAPGETVVDGVNAEQLRKLIVLATRVSDQGGQRDEGPRRRQPSAGPQLARQGSGRFWRDSGLTAREGDGAAAELEAALAPMDGVSAISSGPTAGEELGTPRKDVSPSAKQGQTKRNPTRSSRKK
jgi:hypothetical protein